MLFYVRLIHDIYSVLYILILLFTYIYHVSVITQVTFMKVFYALRLASQAFPVCASPAPRIVFVMAGSWLLLDLTGRVSTPS